MEKIKNALTTLGGWILGISMIILTASLVYAIFKGAYLIITY